MGHNHHYTTGQSVLASQRIICVALYVQSFRRSPENLCLTASVQPLHVQSAVTPSLKLLLVES
jgi:hypothetical protein